MFKNHNIMKILYAYMCGHVQEEKEGSIRIKLLREWTAM